MQMNDKSTKGKLAFWRNRKFWLVLALIVLILIYPAISVFQAFRYTITAAQPPLTTSPANVGLNYQTIAFQSAASDKLQLRGWWIPNPQSPRVVIFVHGRNGNRATYEPLFQPLSQAGFNILTFDLRGHGQSDRAFCTWGIQEQWDVVGAVNFAKSKGFQPQHIGVIGWSVGAASAIMAMRSSSDIKAVVSDSAYANSDPLLAHNLLYPGLVTALHLILNIDVNQIDPAKAIASVNSRHVFLIHGQQDSQVSLANFYQLQKAGGANVTQSWLVPNADHTEAYSTHPSEYIQRVATFFDQELR